MEESRVQELVFSFMKLAGMEPAEIGHGIWKVMIPECEKSFFNGFEELQFTFDRAVAEQHRELQLAREGSYLLRKIIERLGAIPRVSRLFAVTDPELPISDSDGKAKLRLVKPKKVHYRQQIMFNFKVTIRCDIRREILFSALADPATDEVYLDKGLKDLDLSSFSETPDPKIKIHESGHDMLRLYLQTCRLLEGQLQDEIEEIKNWGQQQFEGESTKVKEFLDEQKNELKRKRENVSFHLYFFQKEEEIDKMIADLETEHERKIQELKEKFQLKVEISLINAVVLCVPTIGRPGMTVKKNTDVTSGKISSILCN